MGLLTSGGILAKRNRGAYEKKKKQENTFFMTDFQKGSHISESVRIAPKGLQRAVLEFEEGGQNVATDPLTLEHTNQGFTADGQALGSIAMASSRPRPRPALTNRGGHFQVCQTQAQMS